MRDSWTGYLVPARDGSGLLPDWESSWDAAAVAVAVTWKFRLTFRPGNYILSFQIGFWLIWELLEFWYQGSTQKFEPDWSSTVIWPGEPLLKKMLFRNDFQQSNVHFLWNTWKSEMLTKQKKCSNGHIYNVHLSKIQILEKSKNQLKSLTSTPFGRHIHVRRSLRSRVNSSLQVFLPLSPFPLPISHHCSDGLKKFVFFLAE